MTSIMTLLQPSLQTTNYVEYAELCRTRRGGEGIELRPASSEGDLSSTWGSYLGMRDLTHVLGTPTLG